VTLGEEFANGHMETTQRQGLKLGEVAPDFRLPSARGIDVTLSEYRGRKHIVLAFLRGMT
jgi:peroxiredoxin